MITATRIAPDVAWLPVSFVNVYFIGHPGGPWMLIDAGLPGRANQIFNAAEARFGAGNKPEAIVLTHGHFDHAGSALQLAKRWDVPIFAHPLELPYLTGRSSYPPPDPTIGGAIGFLSRFMPFGAYDFGARVRPLTANVVPGMPSWQWLHTPGHSPGHISLFGASDRVLIAGDAFATMDMESWSGLISGKRTLSRGGSPFNCDWSASKASVQKLADLQPEIVGCGHGKPYSSGPIASRLARFAARLQPPRRGRYVRQAATTDDEGVIALPTAPFDPVPFATVVGLIATGVVLGAGLLEPDDE